ncbi:unnamed protein product [Oikopleura dioica]|uniref:Uncharacterized protein n=1 Tax=Oikopleura dioica TaxID=34765 RepID=E4XSU2_OIKDI|nr:unnamed protein product [Oikopleura dioica]
MVVFEDYDTGSKKYLTPNDLLRAYQKIYRETSNNAQAEAVIASFPNKKLTKEHFKSALNELDRRHCMEQSVYWDYQSLSKYSDREISAIEATTLCQIAHGDSFSPEEWELFLQNRVQGKNAPLSWNDLRVHLCNIPGKSGQKRSKPTVLSDAKKIKLQLEDDEIKKAQAKGKAQAEAQMENLQLEIEYENQRLKDIYKKYGAIAVIFDDGGDGSSFTAIPEKKLEPEPVYDLDWIRRQMSEEEWRKLSEKERQRLLMEAKLLERMLRREMYGDDWQKRLRELGDDEEARRRLLEEQRKRMEKMLALRLLNKKNRQNGENEENDDIIFDVPVDWFDEGDENLAKIEEDYCVDWVKRQMDEEEWRKLSEQERQRLIALAKLEQRKLRREMYGDDWLRYLASLRDQDAIDEAKRRQKEEFDRLLRARLLKKGEKTEEELEKEIEEIIEDVSEKNLEEEYDVDWVKRQLDEEKFKIILFLWSL